VIDVSGCCCSILACFHLEHARLKGNEYPEQRFMSIAVDDSNKYRAGRWAYSKVLNTRTDHEDCTTNEVRRVVEGCTTPSTFVYKYTNARAIVHDLKRKPWGRDAFNST
jgi:hypothetical protein